MSRSTTLLLFDVDGTLTKPRLPADKFMLDFLKKVQQKVQIGFVGGSDLVKIQEQLGPKCHEEFDYGFAENGLMAFKKGKKLQSTVRMLFSNGNGGMRRAYLRINEKSIKDFFGDEKLIKFINFCLHYIADLDIPVKRGTFVEFRTGMLNISPIGRNCSQEERIAFYEYDNENKVREKMIQALKAEFPDLGVTYSIGGQISFDVFPTGWDKTYCLKFVDKEFKNIHFFGDKTYEGGNDFEIFESSRTIGHRVTSPEDTKAQVEAVLQTL